MIPALVTELVALAAAFACGALAAFAAGSAVIAAIGGHPELAESFERRRATDGLPSAVRAWLADVGAVLVGGDRLAGRKRAIQDHLVKAGRPTRETPETFLGEAIAQGVLIALVLMLASLVLWGKPSLILSLGGGLAWAFIVKPYQLQSEAELRVRQVSRRLPFAIDLGILVLEAGGTLREAIEIMAQAEKKDPLAQEMRLVLEGMRAGQTQSRALEDMARRLEIEDLATLVMGINRGEQMGASMKQTLRTQAEMMRERRYQRAEKIASEAPVKMMLPNMLIMIATLLVVMGPMLLKMARGDY